MPWKTVHFAGFLANVDSSILKMRFKHGFKFREMPSAAALQRICILEGCHWRDALTKLAMPHCIGPASKAHIVENCVNDGIEIEEGYIIGSDGLHREQRKCLLIRANLSTHEIIQRR